MDNPNNADADGNTDILHSELVKFLSQSPQMRRTATGSLKQGLWAGAGAMVGSFLLGPPGGVIGGVAGSIFGYLQSDPFDGAILAIINLEERRKKILISEVQKVLVTAGSSMQHLQNVDEFKDALHQFAEQDVVRNGVWRACLNSLES